MWSQADYYIFSMWFLLAALRAAGFKDVDCFWKYFELAVFGGNR